MTHNVVQSKIEKKGKKFILFSRHLPLAPLFHESFVCIKDTLNKKAHTQVQSTPLTMTCHK